MRRIRAASPLAWLPWILVLSLAFLPACGSDDDGGTGPGNGGPGNGDPTGDLPTDGSDLQAIGEAGVQALNFGDQIVGQAVAIATGFGAPRRDTEPVWDPQSMAWVWQINEVVEFDPPNEESRFWNFRLQYYKGEVMQETPDGADRAVALVTFSYSLGRFANEENNRTMSVNIVAEVEITGLGTPNLDVSIEGSGEVFADFTISGEYNYFYTDLATLSMAMELTPGSCPSGSGTFTVGTSFVDWTYVGGPSYDWTVWASQTQVAGGTATLPCGQI